MLQNVHDSIIKLHSHTHLLATHNIIYVNIWGGGHCQSENAITP